VPGLTWHQPDARLRRPPTVWLLGSRDYGGLELRGLFTTLMTANLYHVSFLVRLHCWKFGGLLSFDSGSTPSFSGSSLNTLLYPFSTAHQSGVKPLLSLEFKSTVSFVSSTSTKSSILSPLWHFVGVLRIEGGSGQFRPAHLFTYVLAGLIMLAEVARGMGHSHKGPTGDGGSGRAICAGAGHLVVQATYSPMGFTLSLLLYGRAIAKQTGSRLMVSWSKMKELMYFMGKPILMDDIRSMVADMTDYAEDLLWNVLMFKGGRGRTIQDPVGRH
jgi:hypothetical protein